MTICRFYANGYCRYGNNCRFEHISNTNDYYKKTYHNNRNDGRPPPQQPIISPNRIGFSFNRTLDNVSTNRTYGQQMSFGGNTSNFRQKEIQMTQNRNTFSLQSSSVSTTPRVGFSFNQTLKQLPNERPFDDIDMDSSAVPRMTATTAPNESQTNPFNTFSQPNQVNPSFFGNRPQVVSNNQMPTNIQSVGQKSDSQLKTSDDIYSKRSDLSEKDLKQYESNSFSYQSIPICPPTQALCF